MNLSHYNVKRYILIYEVSKTCNIAQNAIRVSSSEENLVPLGILFSMTPYFDTFPPPSMRLETLAPADRMISASP